MKFFTDKKEDLSVTTDINKKRTRIAIFKNGEFETDNPEVIKKLKTKFRFESPKVVSNIAAFVKLRKKAAELGIDTYKMKKADIIRALEDLKE
ncbi:hypothetical protein ES708_14673 [subsurface metagenome]